MMASECGGKRIGGGVAGAAGYLGQAEVPGPQVVSGESHPPLRQVLHWRLTESVLECSSERRSGKTAERGEVTNGPGVAGVGVDRSESELKSGIFRGVIPARRVSVLPE